MTTYKKKGVAALAATLMILPLTACGSDELLSSITGEAQWQAGADGRRDLADISPSTVAQRNAGGPDEQAVMDAAAHTAGGMRDAVRGRSRRRRDLQRALGDRRQDLRRDRRARRRARGAARKHNAQKLKPFVRNC